MNAFIVPKNVKDTGFAAIDSAIATSEKAEQQPHAEGPGLEQRRPSRSALHGRPSDDGRWVVRGGYGMFYDRPSAAFINTVFSNYPFLREVEVTAPSRAVPIATAFSQQDPTFPFNQYLPNRIVRTAGADGTYEIRDNTNVTRGANGTLERDRSRHWAAVHGATSPRRSSSAPSTAISRRRGFSSTTSASSVSLAHNMALEVRYVGTKGHKLLEARAFNQGYDLNAPDVPDYIYERFNQAYVAAGSPNGRAERRRDGPRARDRDGRSASRTPRSAGWST